MKKVMIRIVKSMPNFVENPIPGSKRQKNGVFGAYGPKIGQKCLFLAIFSKKTMILRILWPNKFVLGAIMVHQGRTLCF